MTYKTCNFWHKSVRFWYKLCGRKSDVLIKGTELKLKQKFCVTEANVNRLLGKIHIQMISGTQSDEHKKLDIEQSNSKNSTAQPSPG